MSSRQWISSSSSNYSSSMTTFWKGVFTLWSSLASLLLCRICNCSLALLYGFGFLGAKVLETLPFLGCCSTFNWEISEANDSIILVILFILGSEDDEDSPFYLLLSTFPLSFSAVMMFDSTSKAASYISTKVAHHLSLNSRQKSESKALA